MKRSRYLLIFLISLILLTGALSSGVLIGYALPRDLVPIMPNILPELPAMSSSEPIIPGSESTASELKELFNPFWETWDIVHDQFIDQPVDDTAMMRGAIRGMLASLDDPYTAYMDPDEYQESNEALEGEYEGIGAWVDITGEYLMITSPIPNSPAEKVGLKPGDRVIAIDGKDMTGLDGELVLSRIKGPAGTEVRLTILRETNDETETFDVVIIRSKIIIPSVEGEILENDIAYIRLYTFGDKTPDELRALLKEMLAKEPVGLILDMRNNGGGFLHIAIEVISEFIEGGKIVMYEEFSDGHRDTLKTSKNGLATEIPLIVLVNEGTASAAEITAGAVQDYQRGLIVGTTTFGKGAVQNWIALSNEEGAVRVTIARWLTPDERQINKVGLEPDIIVEITEEDIEAEHDSQLEKAIEVILSGE